MPVATSVLRYLQHTGVAWQQVLHDRVGTLDAALRAAGVESSAAVTCEALIDARGVVMVVIPVGLEVDLAIVNQHLKRQLQPLSPTQASRLFRDCEPGSFPPLAGAFGALAVCEPRLLRRETLYLQSGCHTTLIRLEREAFQRLMSNARVLEGCCRLAESTLAESAPEPEGMLEAGAGASERALLERLKTVYHLPPMPEIAARIVTLTQDSRSSIDALVGAIEQDPSLAAQILREARSPLYGFRGELNSIKEAIVRVLGYERVSQVALAIAAGRAFDVPQEGRLGLRQFWRHALHSAVLAHRLAFQVRGPEVNPSLVYLAALLHNFGLLLLGHLFRPEFQWLSRRAEQEPETPLVHLERQMLGMGGASELVALGHGRLGALLLEHWQLPAAVVQAARHHQNTEYQGEHEAVVVLVQLANSLLKDFGIGDELTPEDPLFHARRLGLDGAVVFEVFDQIRRVSSEIDQAAPSSRAANPV